MAAIYHRRMPDIASGSSRVLVFGRRFLAAVFWVCAWGPLHAEVPTGRAIESRLASRSISATVASPTAERLFIGGHDGFVEVVSTSTGAVQGRWDIGSPITHIAVDRLAKYVVLATKERDVSIHSAETGEVLLNWKHGQAVTAVSVSGNGRVFASSSRDNTVSIRDMSQWPPSETSFRLPSIARAISLDEKGATILLGLNNGAAELRDLRSRETILSWSHDRMVTSVSFSPDGEHVISASADHKLKITNKKSRSTVVAYEGSRPIQDFKFLSQGRQILIASADEAILLDTLRQERTQHWRGSGWVRALASIDSDDSFVLLADDGTYLLSLRSESGGLRRLQQDGEGDHLSGGSTFGAASTAVLSFDRSRHDNASISVATTRPDDVGLFSIEIRSKEPLSEIHVNGQPRELSSPNFYSGEFYAQLGRQVFDLSITDRSGRSIERTLIIDRDVDQPKPSEERLDPTRLGVSKPRDAVAVIIGIEKYKSVGKALFADRDAKVFYDYAQRALGIRPENIKLLVDEKADAPEVLIAFKNWLPSRVKAGRTNVYVFYSGHGLPSPDGNSLFFLPYEARPDLLDRTAIAQAEVVEALQRSNPKSVTMFIDSCYSGQTRTGETLLASARPIAVATKQATSFPPNFTVLSASAPDQISSSSPDLRHGIFSYYLMLGMEGEADTNKDKQITVAEMQTYLSENVTRRAMGMNRTQQPQVVGDHSRVLVQK